jgi:hypothetical protein
MSPCYNVLGHFYGVRQLCCRFFCFRARGTANPGCALFAPNQSSQRNRRSCQSKTRVSQEISLHPRASPYEQFAFRSFRTRRSRHCWRRQRCSQFRPDLTQAHGRRPVRMPDTKSAGRHATDHVPSKTRCTTAITGNIRTAETKIDRLVRNASAAADRILVEFMALVSATSGRTSQWSAIVSQTRSGAWKVTGRFILGNRKSIAWVSASQPL